MSVNKQREGHFKQGEYYLQWQEGLQNNDFFLSSLVSRGTTEILVRLTKISTSLSHALRKP